LGCFAEGPAADDVAFFCELQARADAAIAVPPRLAAVINRRRLSRRP
jgi:hypothetical protein